MPISNKSKIGLKLFFQIDGNRALTSKIKKISASSSIFLYDALQRSLLMVEAEAKYLVAKGYYQPAIDTGRMCGSITTRITGFSGKEMTGDVGTGVWYAIYVHEGTVKMIKRPFLTDALRNKSKEILQLFKDGYSKFLR